MKLTGRIPVEQLDDERLTNIERRLVVAVAERPARSGVSAVSRRHVWIALVAVVVFAVFGVGWRLGSRPVGSPQLAHDAPLRATTDANRSVLAIGDATITSDPSTVFEVTRPGTGVLITLSRGKVELEVAKRGDRAPLVVRAGTTDVEVVGTRFSVDYGDGTGEVEVRVTEGMVRVVRDREAFHVAAGQAWQARRGLIASAELTAPQIAATPPSELPESASSEAHRAATSVPPPPDVLHDRVARAPDSLPISKSAAPAPSTKRRATSSDRGSVRGAAGQDLRTAIRQQPLAPPSEVGEPDPQRAIAAYLRQLSERKSDAPRALYSIAYVQALKLGKPDDALATLAKVTRFEGGADYTAALWLRVRISCLAAIDERCRQAAHTYARRDPDSAAGRVAQRITSVSEP